MTSEPEVPSERDAVVRLDDVLDMENLARMVAEGFIAEKPGRDGLKLYDYTQRAQFGQVWNRETMTCRGLVALDGAIQSRPFAKFFNLAEHASPELPDLPLEPFDVFEKLDGSLIVASSLPDGQVLLTTRGSFESTQAVAARGLWVDHYRDVQVPPGETWCFEFIAPWNRIVVNYGEQTDLILLAQFDNATGVDLPLHGWPGRVVRSFDGLDDFDAIASRLASLGPDEEGYVLRFKGGMRAKAKGAEYVRLHRLLTGVSARTVWECLAMGTPMDEILDRVPDEFFKWVTVTRDGLLRSFSEIEAECRARHAEIVGLPSRKEQAMAIVDFAHRAAVFKMLDGRPHQDVIWKGLRPAADRPYAIDDGATVQDEDRGSNGTS